MRWYDFVVYMEQLFIRNIYSEKELEKMENLKTNCNYRECFEKFIELIPIIENVLKNPQWIREKEKIENSLRFDLNDVYSHLGEVKEAIDDVKVLKKIGKCNYIDKIICFIYSGFMNFCQTYKAKGIPISETFIENIKGILYNEIHIHHSHVTGDIIGYSHSYCNLRVREKK